jgi:Transposase DDE domain
MCLRTGRSGGLRDGSTRRWSRQYRRGSIKTPDAMRTRRETVEHPFGTIKMRMGATHFLMKTLPKVATEMALCVLTYNLTRVLNIVGVENLMEAIKA